MSAELHTHIANSIAWTKNVYLKDLAALSDEQLASSPGGKARSPYDFTYEVVMVNRWIAKILRGEEAPPMERDGWVTAPSEFCNREAASKAFADSMDEALAAWQSFPLDRLAEKPTESSNWTFAGMGQLVATHAGYHDAQLNLIQAIGGDDASHWD